jgi:hypothetical protein
MDFTLSLARGFHNAPKLYGDDTVRRSEKIVDLHSGLRAARKEFSYGFYDGITGLVTQPLAGAKKEGAAGFIKGAAKGFGGLILKPGAGIWGLPGYTAKGIYAEIAKHFGSSVQNYIIAARTAQGFDDWKNSSPEERAQIVGAWKDGTLETRKRGQVYGQERKEAIENHILTRTNTNSVELVHGFKNTRHLSWDERKALSEKRDQLRKEAKELQRRESEVKAEEEKQRSGKIKSRCKFCPFDHDSRHHFTRGYSTSSIDSAVNVARAQSADVQDDYEAAIQASIHATSTGDPEEDAVIERALRASLRELHNAELAGAKHDDGAYQAAIRASMQEFKKAQEETARETGVVQTPQKHEHDRELEAHLSKSLEEYKSAQAAKQSRVDEDEDHHFDDSDSGVDTDYDDDFKRAIEESKKLHTENELKKKDLADRETTLVSNGAGPLTAEPTDIGGKDDDDELQRAMTASEQGEKLRQENLTKQRTEEEIVLEYIKKQSLREAEFKGQQGGGSAAGTATSEETPASAI